MVLLEHVLPTGERHFDWLLERPGVPDGLLLAFRVFARVDEGAATGGCGERYPAERMKDHRRVYLEFEGELTGGEERSGVLGRERWRMWRRGRDE